MKNTFLLLFLLTSMISQATDKEIIATVVFENMTDQDLSSGKFFVPALNKIVEINSENSFSIVLPERGKYQFAFYSEDFESYTYYPARITSRKNTITIRLENKEEEETKTATFSELPSSELTNLTFTEIEERVEAGEINFIFHSISDTPIDFTDFQEKYGVGMVTKNDVVDPLGYKHAVEHNQIIAEYLRSKYGESWLKDLPSKPFGIK